MCDRRRLGEAKAFACGLLLLAVGLFGCGSSGASLGAVNTLPPNASTKARQQAERCDDGDLGACRWIGIWYSIGGAGNHRKLEGRRFLRWSCEQGDHPSCTLMRALERTANANDAKGSPARAAPSGGDAITRQRPDPAPAPAPSAGDPSGDGVLSAGGAGSGAGTAEGAGPCEAGLPADKASEQRETAQRCDAGNMASCHQVGVWYLTGGAGSQRIGDGARWLKHACDRGHEPSCALVEELRRRLQEMKDQGKI